MELGITLYGIGISGFILNKKNIILMLISLELMLLGISLMFILNSQMIDDSLGIIYGLIIITIAGTEAAIGLGILISYYRLKGDIKIW